MNEVEAAGFSIAYKTAHIALVHRCRLTAGERLLVLGAAGRSGAAAMRHIDRIMCKVEL
jgi:NADPH2:quinone reductase